MAGSEANVPDPPPGVDFDLQAAAVGTNSGGTDDFTKSGFGTPKGVFNALFGTTALGTIRPGGRVGFGASDAIDEAFVATMSADGVASSNSAHDIQNGKAVGTISATSGQATPESQADLSSITDGVRYTWANNGAAADFILSNLMFTGSNLSFKQGIITGALFHNQSTAITGVGFKPDVLIFFCCRANASDSSGSASSVSIGFCDKDLNQGCIFYIENDGLSSSLVGQAMYNNRILFITQSGNEDDVEVLSLDSDGFTVRAFSSGANNWQPDIGYIALKLASPSDGFVGFHDLPTVTGAYSITGVPFRPRLVLQLDSAATAFNTRSNKDGLIGLSMLTTGAQISGGTAAANNVATMDTKSVMNNKAVWYPTFVGDNTAFEGDFSGFRNTGYQIDYNKVESTAFKGAHLALR